VSRIRSLLYLLEHTPLLSIEIHFLAITSENQFTLSTAINSAAMTSPSTSPSPSTLQTLPLPTLSPPRSIHLISNLLTPTECTSLIDTHTNLIPSNVTPTTVRDREIFTDPGLASLLWSRIATFFQEKMGKVVDEDGEAWTVRGLNETFRLCRYTQGTFRSPPFPSPRIA